MFNEKRRTLSFSPLIPNFIGLNWICFGINQCVKVFSISENLITISSCKSHKNRYLTEKFHFAYKQPVFKRFCLAGRRRRGFLFREFIKSCGSTQYVVYWIINWEIILNRDVFKKKIRISPKVWFMTSSCFSFHCTSEKNRRFLYLKKREID